MAYKVNVGIQSNDLSKLRLHVTSEIFKYLLDIQRLL